MRLWLARVEEEEEEEDPLSGVVVVVVERFEGRPRDLDLLGFPEVAPAVAEVLRVGFRTDERGILIFAFVLFFVNFIYFA